MIPVFSPMIGEREKELVAEVMDSGWLTEGEKTSEFEEALASFLGVKYVVAVSSGGVALYLALLAKGVYAGDKVVIPIYQHISLANAVRMIGAIPEFRDVKENGCMKIESPDAHMATVNMNGRYSEIDENATLSFLVEDSCQALPSTINGRHLRGNVGCLSFHPTKILTTGNGGAIFTDSELVYEAAKRMKDYGRFRDTNGKVEENYASWGLNFRFTDLQAVIGLAQLETLPERVQRICEIYRRYQTEIKGIIPFKDQEGFVPWVCDIWLKSNSILNPALILSRNLALKGIETNMRYVPLNLNSEHYPKAHDWYFHSLILPSSPYLTDEEVMQVIDVVNEVMK